MSGDVTEFADLSLVLATVLGMVVLGHPLREWLRRYHVPPAVSLMALGVVLGHAVADLLPAAYVDATSPLSKAAFVVLLLRAGLGLLPSALKSILVPALVFGLVPVAVELAGVALLARSFDLVGSWELAILAGFLVAAVSPAVILPTMLNQKDAGRGGPRFVPDRIMGHTVLNALVAKTGILLMIGVLVPERATGSLGETLAWLPLSIAGGILAGIAVGAGLRLESILGTPGENPPTASRTRVAVLVLLAVGLVVYFMAPIIGVENVFATLAVGIVLRRRLGWCEPALREELKRVWGIAEIVLFVNLGSKIDLERLTSGSLVLTLLAVLAAALALRLVVVWVLAARSCLTPGERQYLTAAHVPKATIQAVFGAAPLIAFQEYRPELVGDGQTLLILAVLAIVATAPFGAVLLDRLGERCLIRDDEV